MQQEGNAPLSQLEKKLELSERRTHMFRRPYEQKSDVATDDRVVERFKRRMMETGRFR